MSEIEAEAESKPEGNAPGKTRSERSETTYPYFGLSNALKVMQAVRKAGGTDAPSSDVMRELGIEKTTDRYWAYGIPAAAQFGLIERVGRGESGRIKLTELGMRVALPGPGEERAAKVAAFKTPELYTKLLERFAGAEKPSKEGLKNILHRDYRIVESMAPLAADAFLDSLAVAGLIAADGTISTEGLPTVATVAAEEKPTPQGIKPSQPPAPDGKKAIYVPEDYVIYKCKISGGLVIDIPLPPKLTSADVNKLHNFLQTQVDDEPKTPGATGA